MGYQLANKLKFLRDKMEGWRKDVFGSILLRKNQLLADMRRIDGKEEDGSFEEEDRANKQFLQEQYR